ncbi:HlyD family efflux transporter periplasmic adaptor subunit [Niallia taxi]|nr:HlyD family efflux transporter periplasmic adaptor subunit [Niallia taxi]MDE5056010.1 HlyD family efflux transporter periplasmic adaptor subunit [Niallia taxi]
MADKVRSIDELTDSIEMLEKRPPRFIKIFIFLLCLILIIAFCWSYYGKMDVSVTAQAVATSDVEAQSVIFNIDGEVSKIKVKPGERIKKGQELVTLVNKDLDLEKKTLKENINNLTVDIEDRNLLKKAVKNQDSTLPKGIQEVVVSELLSYLKQISLVKTETKILEQEQEQQMRLLVDPEDPTLIQFQSELETAYRQKKEIEDKLSNSDDKDTLKELKSQLTEYNEVIEYKKKQIGSREEQIQVEKESLQERVKSNSLKMNNSIEELKTAKVLEIDQKIKDDQTQLKSMKQELKKIDELIKQNTILSKNDGVVEMPSKIDVGYRVEAGKQLFSIVSNEGQNTKRILLYVNSQEINGIKEEDKIKYTFELGKSQNFYGKIKQIYKDPIVNEKSGESFFVIETELDKNSLKSGSIGKASIVVDETKPLSILLEKIGFKE